MGKAAQEGAAVPIHSQAHKRELRLPAANIRKLIRRADG